MTSDAVRVTAYQASGGTKSTEAKRQTEDMIRAAHLVADNCGLSVSPSKVSKLVRIFQWQVEAHGVPFFDYFANAVQLTAAQRYRAMSNPDVARVIAYADPTGETAVKNVMKERA